MSHRPNHRIDGFTARRTGTARLGTPRPDSDTLPVPSRYLKQPAETTAPEPEVEAPMLGQALPEAAVARHEIDQSLAAIDNEVPPKRRRRIRITKKFVKRTLLFVACVLLAVGGYFGVKIALAGSSMFEGNLFNIFSNKQLKRDTLGRSNILIFGTSEDDPGHADSGAELTDSMMVLSVDQTKKNAVMFSIPRDLWVDYGQSCVAGYQGKINAFYECAKQGTSDTAGATKLKAMVGDVFGIDIQYYAKVNYSALKQAVDAVGGIGVVIDSDDPRGVMDTNFDWQCGTWAQRKIKCPPNGHMVDYPNGMVTLDGEHALALARARNAAGGYGLSGGNFAREQYQQKILIAIKEKAVTAGTLANPVAVSNLIDSFGNNVRTNFETSEIKTLVELAKSIQKSSIRSISLVKEDKPLVTTGNYSGQSIVRPVAGLTNFSQIQSFVQSQLSGETGTSEDATIEVLNASDRSGVASKKQSELAAKGVIVTSIGDAPTTRDFALRWYDMTGGQMPQTAKKLTTVMGKESSGSTLPTGVQSAANFVIIIGDGSD